MVLRNAMAIYFIKDSVFYERFVKILVILVLSLTMVAPS